MRPLLNIPPVSTQLRALLLFSRKSKFAHYIQALSQPSTNKIIDLKWSRPQPSSYKTVLLYCGGGGGVLPTPDFTQSSLTSLPNKANTPGWKEPGHRVPRCRPWVVTASPQASVFSSVKCGDRTILSRVPAGPLGVSHRGPGTADWSRLWPGEPCL